MIPGERVRLRRPERADLPRFAAWLNDPEVRRHLALIYSCYEKVGFRHEGRLRQDRFQDGRYLDTLVMGLLREEYGGA